MRLSVLVAAIGLSVVGLTLADESHASIKRPTHIPPQPLGSALQTLAKDRGFQVVYESAEINPLRTKGASGELTSEEALTQLLSGTGFTYQFYDDNAVSILPANAKAPRQAPLSSNTQESRKSATDTFRLAQENQGAPASDASVEKNKDSEQVSQKKPVQLEEIVVTGTHIHGIDNKINPVIVIDQEQIQRSGYSSTEDLFRSLPQNFQNVASSQDGYFSATPAAGNNWDAASGVDLRGLGPNSTLVLLNGHRLAPSAYGSFVDLSLIPLPAIERVEILTDGSSAVYGSDAVGGVVNIILKKDYQGADTSVRYGATTSGGRDELLASQTLGTNWSAGNVVSTIQFQRQGALPATDRPDSASSLTVPNDLFPSNRSYGFTLDGRQALADGLELYGDILAARRKSNRLESSPYGSFGNFNALNDADTQSLNVSPSLRYSLSSVWTIELNGLYGYQKSITDINEGVPGLASTDLFAIVDNRFTEKSIDLISDGRLVSTTAGDIAIAFGGSYRTEHFNNTYTDIYPDAPELIRPSFLGRHVTAEFAELHLPIAGPANRIPLVQALELSAAVRRDDYSDFGSTTNPHVGLRWAPGADLSLRASYGKSFRAPNAFEEGNENQPEELYTLDFLNPTGPGEVPALVLAGSKILTAERARTLDFGLEYKPAYIHGFSATLDYYDIRYQNRIVGPLATENFLQQPANYGLISPVASDAAAQALVSAVTAAGGQFFDYTNNGTGIAGVRYFIDSRQQNASLVRQSGFDLTSSFVKEFGGYTLTSRINIAFIDKIDTQYSEDAEVVNLVNTFGNPAKWRARFESTWGNAAYSVSGALNAVGHYVDTNALGNPPIASWATVDLNATLNIDALLHSYGWRGLSLSVIVLNAFNREPPFVENMNAENPISYDSANANPLGRLIAVAVRKKW